MYAFTNILRSRGPALKKERKKERKKKERRRKEERKKKERRKKERKRGEESFSVKGVSASQTSRKSVHGKHINEALPGGTRFNGFCPVPIT